MEAHRLQKYGHMVITDAYPLLLLLSDTASSEGIPLDWIENVANEFTALLALIDETWLSAVEDESVKQSTTGINLIFDLRYLDPLWTFVFHNPFRQPVQDSVVGLTRMLIQRSCMMLFRKEDTFQPHFSRAYSVSIEKPFEHGK
jgi:hypothetical protein